MKREEVTSSLHEWGIHKIWEVASYVYANEFEHLDQPECNFFSQLDVANKINCYVEKALMCRGISSSASV